MRSSPFLFPLHETTFFTPFAKPTTLPAVSTVILVTSPVASMEALMTRLEPTAK